MNNAEHSHRLSFYWWFGNIIIGSFILFIVFGTFIANAQELTSGDLGIADYLGVIVLIFAMFPVGLDLLARPFVTKIIVKVHGLEYRTTTYVLLADWKDLVNMGYVKGTYTGKSLVVVPRAGHVMLRTWAKPFRRFLRHNPNDVEILVSQFRASNGHSFETDILVNVSQRAELPQK